MTDKKPEPKLADLAKSIAAHLARFEKDPAISHAPDRKDARFWSTGCVVRGRFIAVTYVGYQSAILINKNEAATYLKMLDSGFVGNHFKGFRELRATQIQDQVKSDMEWIASCESNTRPS